jgi:hypothetical protein
MRRLIWSALIATGFTAAVTLGTMVLAAQQHDPASPSTTSPQTQSPPSSPASPATTTSDSAKGSVTVTGCLQEAAPSPTGTSGSTSNAAPPEAAAPATTTAGAADEPKFVLTKAVEANAPGTTTTTTRATSGAPSQTYRLIANDSALRPHVGKKVELTGTLEAATATTTADASPKLRVTSGKVLAASCLE